MGILYYLALVIDVGTWYQHWAVALNYALKALLTIPLLWLFFTKLAAYSIWKRGLLHLIMMPLYTLIWIAIYYQLCDAFHIFRFSGSRQVWDFYLTVLFYCIQFGVFHLYVYSNQLKAQELLTLELGKLNIQSELSALKAQLNPHFLYNVFNTINAAIPITAKNARNMITELSDLFRYQLRASREELVPLHEEISFVAKYLDLEKERFGERLRYELNIDKGVEEVLIPPIIIQPLVENSIKHGISPLIEGGEVNIRVNRIKDILQVTVCDTGKGMGSQNEKQLLIKGVGLSNTHMRLLRMYGKGLELTEHRSGGLCVCISIPLDKNT